MSTFAWMVFLFGWLCGVLSVLLGLAVRQYFRGRQR